MFLYFPSDLHFRLNRSHLSDLSHPLNLSILYCRYYRSDLSFR